MTRRHLIAPALVATVALTAPAGGAAASPAPERAHPGGAASGDSLFPLAGNGGYGVRHYDLALSYRPSSDVLQGTARLRIRTNTGLSRFNLDLQGLRVSRVSVDGRSAKWSRSGHELVVRPVAPLPARTGHDVVVRYSGVPHTHIDPDGSEDGWVPTDDGAVAVNEPVGAMTWFPVNNTPRDKATYRIAITAPARLTGVSNGNLVRRTRHGRTATWVWRERDAMASYLSTVAIGHFDVIRSRVDGVPLRSFVDPQVKGGARTARKVASVLRVWDRRFGPYPFSSSGVIIDRADFGYALEVQTRPVFPFNPDQLTLVHELAHQWYGDSVTLKDWSDIWLHEGFATYAEWLWQARRHPGAPHRHFDRLYRTPADSSLWSPPPAVPGTGEHLFGSPVYTRGAMALQALRERIGGRHFFTVLRRWAAEYRQGSGTTAELQQLAEHVSGRRLDHLFHAWLYHDGKPRHWML
ncbi:MAG: M1 family metallopeptidase [Nocardioidaceae bacterium]